MRAVFKIIILLTLVVTGNPVFAENKEFPGRDLFPTITYVELDDFFKKFKSFIVVDVRSEFEYGTLHIKGAKNIPLASKTFIKELRELRDKSKNTIAVYCNGKTCMKSYEAARKAALENISDVVAFDSGILDWAAAHPQLAMLLDEPLNDARKLISTETFEKHLISPSDFGEMLADGNDIVLDVRDRFQREGLSIFVGREYRVSLDNKEKLVKYITKAQAEKKGLLIYDASGHQVRWLQYYLEKHKVDRYFFMKGGIHSYYNNLTADMSNEGKK